MKFFTFTSMAWPNLPRDYDGDAWITCSNELYDPAVGHELYRGFIDLLAYADELGFDGIGVNEHHQTPYCLSPSPNIMAGIAARITSRAQILVLGNALPLYNPLRVAEEYAMIDVISGGRLIAGMVVGDQPGYYSYNVNPTEARSRYNEALELIRQAWTKRGPFAFEGEYFRYRFVNPWPRPMQQPHPPIWIPGIGSFETIEFCAQNNLTYVSLPFFHKDLADNNYGRFRQTWMDVRGEADPSKLGLSLPVYVAETDTQARAEFEEHFYYFNRLTKGIFPNAPGYMSDRSMVHMLELVEKGFVGGVRSWEEAIEGGFIVVGSPTTVAEELSERLAATGAGNLITFLQTGSLPHELAKKNHALFAEEVMPLLRKEYPNGPEWREASG